MAYAPQLDTIYLRNLNISAVIGPDAWGRKDRAQPVVLNIRLKIDTTTSSTSDDIHDTFSYGQMSKEITSQLDGKSFNNLQHLITVLTTFAAFWPGEDTKLQALAPKALLRVEGGLEISHSIRKKDRYEENGVPQVRHVDTRSWSIKGLKLACIIGVNRHERLQKQSVNIDLRIPAIDPRTFDAREGSNENWRTLVNRVCEVVEYSSFETLEALAARIAKTALDGFPVQEITVSVEKPSALTFVEGAGVEVTRRKESYADVHDSSERTSEASRPRMTLDQYKRAQAKEHAKAKPPTGYPPMHQAPTIQQYQEMKRKGESSEQPPFNDSGMPSSRSGITSPRSIAGDASNPTSPAAGPSSPGSTRNGQSKNKTKHHKASHSVSQSTAADSASYYVDGSVDQASPVRSHDFAKERSKQRSESALSPRSQKSYLNGQYDYDGARPFSPVSALVAANANNSNAGSRRVSSSSSMFGAVPAKAAYLQDMVGKPVHQQRVFLVDGTDDESEKKEPANNNNNAPPSKGMPGSFAETPKVAKAEGSEGEGEAVKDEVTTAPAAGAGAGAEKSYFDQDGELKEKIKANASAKAGGGRDDVSIGEAF
ncbi:MAG: hypothetical protein L6R37_004122 [Teloschistes peruensis]|nr:MAG: hypothetical protein L6R37_004122 [Teloschistes peruensis]